MFAVAQLDEDRLAEDILLSIDLTGLCGLLLLRRLFLPL